jgi:hypothetical protein
MINEGDIEGMALMPLFSRYLMASYLYYELNEDSPWSDSQFDGACKRLYSEWSKIQHPNKSLTKRKDLKAGTGFMIRYPPWVPDCAKRWQETT